MRVVEIDEGTYDRLLVAARLMERSVGEVITRLVDRLASDGEDSADTGGTNLAPDLSTASHPPRLPVPIDDWITVFKVYKGHRLEGAFHPRTREVRLSTPPWTNKVFPSPTAAAVAVVEHFSGDVRESPNTNGRKFWKVADTGKNLHSIIGER